MFPHRPTRYLWGLPYRGAGRVGDAGWKDRGRREGLGRKGGTSEMPEVRSIIRSKHHVTRLQPIINNRASNNRLYLSLSLSLYVYVYVCASLYRETVIFPSEHFPLEYLFLPLWTSWAFTPAGHTTAISAQYAVATILCIFIHNSLTNFCMLPV